MKPRPTKIHQRREERGGEPRTQPDLRQQEELAEKQISRGLDAGAYTNRGIDAATARLIAATLHVGPGTALEHFAATGALHLNAALSELEGGDAELHQVPWLAALWDFLERIERPDPDLPELYFDEPTPQIYVQVSDPETGLQANGRWLDTTVTATELRDQLGEIALTHDNDRTKTAVTGSVGFYDLEIDADAPAKEIAHHGLMIARHGEAYALYAGHAGFPVDEGAFLLRYHDSYPSVFDFIASMSQGTAPNSTDAVPTVSAASAVALHDLETALRGQWLCLDGRSGGVHVFNRQFGLPEREET